MLLSFKRLLKLLQPSSLIALVFMFSGCLKLCQHVGQLPRCSQLL
jgi:hypothetical protein